MPNLFNQFPAKLPATEEAALAGRIAQGGPAGETALNTLVLANMQEALLYTRRVCDYKIRDDVLVSLCYQELMASGKRFKAARGRFFAYAKAGLRGRLADYKKTWSVVRNSTECLSLDVGGAEQDVHPNQTRLWCNKHGQEVAREIVTGEIEEPKIQSWIAQDQWEAVKRQVWHRLSEQEQMVVTLTYDGGLNFSEIGKLLDVSKAAVQIMHKRALKKLRYGVKQVDRLF